VLKSEIRAEASRRPKNLSIVGVRGMQERLRQLGGTLNINSNNNGTTVMASLPVSSDEDDSASQA
jgi:signal transduction histidine kinase